MNEKTTFLKEMSFHAGTNKVTFYKLYNDCWVCVLPDITARRIQFETFEHGKIRVCDLDFTTRAFNVMRGEDIETVAELVKLNYDLLKVPNMGKGTYLDIIKVLEVNGIKDAAIVMRSALKKKKRLEITGEEP